MTKALADLTTKATAEADELRRQLAAARQQAAQAADLQQRLNICKHASELLVGAVK